MRLIFLCILLLPLSIFAQGYKISVEIKGLPEEMIYLAFHFADKQYVVDSIKTDKNGKAVFAGKKNLDPGVYLIALQENSYFDVLIDKDQNFSIYNDVASLSENFKCTGSTDNELLLSYQLFALKIRKEINELGQKKAILGEDVAMRMSDSLNLIMRDKRKALINSNPNTFFSVLLTAMSEPDVPESVMQISESVSFQYYKQHYFDNINFNDARLLRSPIVFNKINHFFNYLCEWHQDTVVKYALQLCRKSELNPEFFQFVFNHLFTAFEKSGKFTNDEAFVKIAETYCFTGKTPWFSPETIEKIKLRIEQVKPTLIGNPVPELAINDSSGKPVDYKKTSAEFYIFFFWDPECEHCRDLYYKLQDASKDPEMQSVKTISVFTGKDQQLWKKFIVDKQAPFIHVIPELSKLYMLEKWDLYMTPRIFVLDSQYRIMLKDPDPASLKELLYGR